MMEYVDVMLDLETMGVGNSPALVQIAAIAFNSKTGEELSKFDEKIDLASSMDAGLTITASTVKFWMCHPSVTQVTRDIVMSETSDYHKQGQSLQGVLLKFSKWITSLPEETSLPKGNIWGNGSASDNVWVRSAYDATTLPAPFTFREDMCLRTLRTLTKRKGYVNNLEFEGNQHDGLDDCRYQIADLIAINTFLEI